MPQDPSEPEAEAPEDQPSEAPPPAQEDPPPRPASAKSPDPAAAEAAKAAKRREHMQRALKASGRALEKAAEGAGKETDEDEDADPEDDEKEPDEKAEKDETAAEKSARLAKLDKVKSHKHLDKALTRHKAEVAELDERERKHREQQAKDDRVNAAVTREYGPFAEARAAYQRKDYRGTAQMLKGLLGDEFPQIARNIWNATKDGMATADLRQELEAVKAKLADKETQATTATQTAQKTTEEKQLRATFDKRIKGHDLSAIGDDELTREAFEKWRASWDEDLGEYSLSSKKAADYVLDKHKKRAEKLSGKRSATPRSAPRETREPASNKPLREMSKDEKRKFHMDRALRQTQATRRERERHA